MGNFFSKAALTQSAWIPTPILTEKNLPSQAGKVHIVTGGYAGVGEQLVQILYGKGAKVYIAGRSESKAQAAIKRIEANTSTSSKGELVFLKLDLSDLASIKKSAEEFMSKESRLDVLTNNAGVMFPPPGSKGAQGHDLQFVTNILGPHLFTKLLHPVLVKTAKIAPSNSVRVTWASSIAIQVMSPEGGVQFDDNGKMKSLGAQLNYGQTKTANVLLAIKTQDLLKSAGVVSTSFNPGNLKTELQRHSFGAVIWSQMLYAAKYGAYTELWCGWSDGVTPQNSPQFVMPWGRDGTDLIRADIKQGIEKEDLVDKLWKYCENETSKYA